MFTNILVAYDGSDSSRAAVRQAFELAESNDGHVTVLTVAPSVAPLVALGGVSVDQLRDDLEHWSHRTAAEAVAAAPEGLAVRAVERSGHIGEEIVAEIEAGGYDLVMLGSRGRGRLSSELLGSANGYVHFHSTIPLLSISAPDPARNERAATALAGSTSV
jgi:nucleotide-binding universal stress UspA family protein